MDGWRRKEEEDEDGQPLLSSSAPSILIETHLQDSGLPFKDSTFFRFVYHFGTWDSVKKVPTLEFVGQFCCKSGHLLRRKTFR